MEETNLLQTLRRTKTSIDINYEYLRMWLKANDLYTTKHFVCWIEGKIPINVYTGGGAQSNNPQTWATFEQCIQYKNTHKEIKGIGIMLGVDDKGRQIVGIDIDHITKNKLIDTMNDILSTVCGYQEISQSGDGVHIITLGTLPKGIRKKGGLEIYDTGRYIALTGTRVYVNAVADPIEDQTENISTIYTKYFGGALEIKNKEDIDRPVYLQMGSLKQTKLNKDTDSLIEKAMNSDGGDKFRALYNGEWEGVYESQSQADMALATILAFWTQKDFAKMDAIFRSSKLMRDKWDSKRGEMTYGEITLNNAITKCGVVYNPEYNLSPLVPNDRQEASQPQLMSIGRQVDENGEVLDFDLNDTGNARRFCFINNEIAKYNIENNAFMVWNGVKWDADNRSGTLIKPIFDIFADSMKQDMTNEPDKDIKRLKAKNVERLYSNAGKKAVLEECEHQKNMPVRNRDFDNNDYLLNTPNGILDLENHTILPTNKNLFQSQVSGTMCLDTPTPLWDKFLMQTFDNQETIDFIQKAVGQTIIGNNKEQKFFMLYGMGANGKSVFLDIMQRILGDYCKKLKMSVFTSEKIADNSERVFATLQKCRMLVANEIKEGKSLEVGLLKDITGGGNIQGRYLYGEVFEYEPKFTLWMAVNTKPFVNDESDGFWRRSVLIECPNAVKGDQIDINLEDKLMKEAPGILNWCFIGATKLLKEGLKLTQKMELDVLDYKNEMSVVDRFLEEKVDVVPEATTKAMDLYNSYYRWAKRDNQVPMNSNAFARKISAKFTKIRKSDGIYYTDCFLKQENYL